MLHRGFISVLAALALPLVAHADQHILYECTDAAGAKQFTNVPPKNKASCKVLSVGTLNPPAGAPHTAAPKSGAKGAAASPSPANFPKVDRETQQTRDSQRKRILDQELANEQKLLDQAKKDLAEQEAVRLGTERNYQKVLDRLEPYQKKVKQHEDNITSLRRELSNLR
jgi:hypothetical protein